MKTEGILDAICQALNREPGSISLEDTPETVEEWDSVGHLLIIATIDSKLDVAMDNEEMISFTSIQELVDLLKSKGALED